MEVALAAKVLVMLLGSEEDEVSAGAAMPLVELKRLGIVSKTRVLEPEIGRSIHGRGKDRGSRESRCRDTQIVAISAMLQMETSMRRAGSDGAHSGQEGEDVRGDEQHGKLSIFSPGSSFALDAMRW